MSQGSLQQDDTTETDLDEESESEYSDTFRHSCEIALHFLPLLIVMIGSLAWTCQMAITSRSLLSDTDLTYLAQLNRSAFMWYDLRQLNAADQLRIALSQLPVVAVFGILTLIVVLGTLLMACLFERGCFRLLQCWLIMAYALMLGPITAFLLHRSVSGRYAFCIDMATILILFWNFGQYTTLTTGL